MKLTERGQNIFNFDTVQMRESDRACVGGRMIYYALLELCKENEKSYAIAVGDGNEAELCLLDKALDPDRVYELILSGEVTPCTLGDILDDLTAETIS